MNFLYQWQRFHQNHSLKGVSSVTLITCLVECSLEFPVLEYCCLKLFCNPFQSKAIDMNDSYHNLAFPAKVKQNLWILWPSWNAWVSIQSVVLRRCYSTSSSGLHANSGLKWDQFNCGIGPGWMGCAGWTAGCAGGAGHCMGGTGGTTGGIIGGGWGVGGLLSAVSIYVVGHVTRNES